MLDLLKHISTPDISIPALMSLRLKGKNFYCGLPTQKTEAYKYTPFYAVLSPDMFQSASEVSHDSCHCHEQSLPFQSFELHYCNGCPHLHFPFIEGVEISSLVDAVAEHEIQRYINKFDCQQFPFAALNTACLYHGLFIRISKTPDKPISLIYHNKHSGAKNVRNIIVIENGVHAEIIETHEGNRQAYFSNIVNEIFIAKNAVLKHYKRQNESINSAHIALSNVQIKAGGQYESYTYQKGARIARNETHILLKEENAGAVVNSAYHINGTTLIDTTTDIEHLACLTQSNQLVRGAVDGHAHGVFQGKIHIEPNAQKTQGYQLHNALLLSDDAHIDVKPELEIFADDVKCSHGATSGDINEEELFYLKSRGIDELTARQILISAFLNTAFENITNPDIKEFLTL